MFWTAFKKCLKNNHKNIGNFKIATDGQKKIQFIYVTNISKIIYVKCKRCSRMKGTNDSNEICRKYFLFASIQWSFSYEDYLNFIINFIIVISSRNMGNCNESNPQPQHIYNHTNWQLITQNHYSVIMKSYTNPQIQFQKWLSDKIQKPVIYSWRTSNQTQGFCKIQRLGEENYYLGSNQEKEKRRSYVITQILTPLSQFSYISTSEAILLLKIILPALKLLCERFGWFQISNANININSQGKPSVWIHPNLASNSPQKHYSATAMSQQTFLASVITVLRAKLQKYQKLEVSYNCLSFQKMNIWLNKELSSKYPKLTKIYKNRGEFQLSAQRRKYKQIAKPQTNQIFIDQRVKNITTDHKNKAQQVLHFSANANLKTEEITNDKFMSSVKDPDELLFEMLRDYDDGSQIQQ